MVEGFGRRNSGLQGFKVPRASSLGGVGQRGFKISRLLEVQA